MGSGWHIPMAGRQNIVMDRTKGTCHVCFRSRTDLDPIKGRCAECTANLAEDIFGTDPSLERCPSCGRLPADGCNPDCDRSNDPLADFAPTTGGRL